MWIQLNPLGNTNKKDSISERIGHKYTSLKKQFSSYIFAQNEPKDFLF